MRIVHHLGVEREGTNFRYLAILQPPDCRQWHRECLTGRLTTTRHVTQYHHMITVRDDVLNRVIGIGPGVEDSLVQIDKIFRPDDHPRVG